ncbi:hypothetical protein GCM10007094_24000 [Pseudovibrio japonicus]|uniref:Phage major tail tube protein n=1 Tax=Pseudovibrio japonicus TaxID=366534 RepID=A0ABQ3EDJ1_9HYPH|nr:phage major tail tube protein [Pseudovibrio japonicus]GHB34129.1 hypothetical protein GCM10007094_24000 [Pseudovibrio japonicus]
MRHVHGFTTRVDSKDYGENTTSVKLPEIKAKTQESHNGATDLGLNNSMMALEPLEPMVTIDGIEQDMAKYFALPPGQRVRFMFIGAVINHTDGVTDRHVIIIEGAPKQESAEEWKRGETNETEFGFNDVRYYKRSINGETIDEIQHYPPKRIIGGVDFLRGVNNALYG